MHNAFDIDMCAWLATDHNEAMFLVGKLHIVLATTEAVYMKREKNGNSNLVTEQIRSTVKALTNKRCANVGEWSYLRSIVRAPKRPQLKNSDCN